MEDNHGQVYWMKPDRQGAAQYVRIEESFSQDLQRRKELERWHRRRMLKKLAQVGILGAALIISLGYILALRLKPDPRELNLPRVAKDEGIRIDKFTYSNTGAHPFELEAQSATVADSLDKVKLFGPRVTYMAPKKGKIELTAKTGELDKNTKEIRASGDVKIKMNGLLINADEVTYSDEERVVRADSKISIHGDGFKLSGAGLTLFLDNHEAIVSKNVETLLSDVEWVKPGQKLPI